MGHKQLWIMSGVILFCSLTFSGCNVKSGLSVEQSSTAALDSANINSESASEATQPQDSPEFVEITGGNPVLADHGLKSHSALQNPYRDAYQACDQWIADNALLVTLAPSSAAYNSELAQRSGSGTVFTLADKQGYILPFREAAEMKAAARQHKLSLAGYRYVYASGQLDQSTGQQIRDLDFQGRAKHYPPVPDWLMTGTPEGAILLPNGEVITRGEVGKFPWDGERNTSHAGHGDTHSGVHSSKGWSHYSADGKLLNQISSGPWILMFNADVMDYIVDERYEKEARADGYWVFVERETKEFAAGFDWDGSRLDSSPPPRPGQFALLSGDMLLGLHLQGGR
jgi:hypothetical protein